MIIRITLKAIYTKHLKAQSHLDVWRERVNNVRGNHQHVQNWTCALSIIYQRVPNVSNVSKSTAHRVDTVMVPFPKHFHTVCERVAARQTSIQRVPDVYVTCKYRAQRVPRDRPTVFYRATSVHLPYFTV